VSNYDEFLLFKENDREYSQVIAQLESKMIPKGASSFFIPGYCVVCSSYTEFFVDYAYAPPAINGIQLPNWRERLECRSCGLNNRMRAVLHFLVSNLKVDGSAQVYLTEQTTPLFRAFEGVYPGVVGSEYLRDGTAGGHYNADCIRHEDVTALTFPASSFDAICSFDVLEHVPSYQVAFDEFFRCIKPGGNLLLTVPFFPDRARTLTRAAPVSNGSDVMHFEPPEYHGDPLNDAGVLCFYHFGWDLLAAMRQAGFSDPKLSFYWSLSLGYLGGRQFLISASRPI
jgi:SAM-dependent methyltransferase